MDKKELLNSITYLSFEEKMSELNEKNLNYKVHYNYPFLTVAQIATLCEEKEEEILVGIKSNNLTGIKDFVKNEYVFVADEIVTILDLKLKGEE